jgi:RNA polymerase sigma-70 factor (TIGR02943 family)
MAGVAGRPMKAALSMLPSATQQIADLRGYLLKFARLQLRNEAWAEDAVSETLLAALAKPQAFAQRAQLKTWLIGILKHKLIDILRVQAREIALGERTADELEDPLEAIAFTADGHFVESPAQWGNPEQAIMQREFFEILEACVDHLPAVQARLFLMREWLEMSSAQICKELELTPTNCYVLLHRARLRLQECLSVNWYGERGSHP